MNAQRIAEAGLLRALSQAALPPPFERLAAGRAEQRPLALVLLRLAEKSSLAEIHDEVAAIAARLEGLGGKEGKDSARRLVRDLWRPLLDEIKRQQALAEEPLDLASETFWEGLEIPRRTALAKEIRALFGTTEPTLDPAFLTERLRLRLRAKAREWLDDEHRLRATPKGDQ